jgi:hypothetical protein
MTMTSTELAQDGTVVLRTLADPARGLAEAVGRRRVATALGVSTLALLLFTAVAVPRVDYDAVAEKKLQGRGPDAGEVTQFQREEAAAAARKLGYVQGYTVAVVVPSLATLLAACFLYVGFRVAGTKPAFKPTFAATAHGQLPVFLAPLLSIPALLVRGVVPPDARYLAPTSLGALFPKASPPLAAALSSADLFTLWAVVLVALGMARASGASRRRAFAVTIVLFLSYVALVQVVPAALFAGGPGPRGGP